MELIDKETMQPSSTERMAAQVISCSSRVPDFAVSNRARLVRQVFSRLIEKGLSPTQARQLAHKKVDEYIRQIDKSKEQEQKIKEDTMRGDNDIVRKTAADDSDEFLSGDHPEKVKEIYKKLKEKYPHWSPSKLARTAYTLYPVEGKVTRSPLEDRKDDGTEDEDSKFLSGNHPEDVKKIYKKLRSKYPDWSPDKVARVAYTLYPIRGKVSGSPLDEEEDEGEKRASFVKWAGKKFLERDIPDKVKEIYKALKREHPDWPAGKKARIAFATYNKMKKSSSADMPAANSAQASAAPVAKVPWLPPIAGQLPPAVLRSASALDNILNRVFFGNPKIATMLAQQLAARIFGNASGGSAR